MKFVLSKHTDPGGMVDTEFAAEVYLNPELPWWKRFWRAVKYATHIGYPCVYGQFDEFTANRPEMINLLALADSWALIPVDYIHA